MRAHVSVFAIVVSFAACKRSTAEAEPEAGADAAQAPAKAGAEPEPSSAAATPPAAKGPPTQEDCDAWAQHQVELAERMMMADSDLDDGAKAVALEVYRKSVGPAKAHAADQCLKDFTREDLNCFDAAGVDDDAWSECLVPIGKRKLGQ